MACLRPIILLLRSFTFIYLFGVRMCVCMGHVCRDQRAIFLELDLAYRTRPGIRLMLLGLVFSKCLQLLSCLLIPTWNSSFSKLVFYLCAWVFCLYVCLSTYHVCAVPTEAGRGVKIPWTWG